MIAGLAQWFAPRRRACRASWNDRRGRRNFPAFRAAGGQCGFAPLAIARLEQKVGYQAAAIRPGARRKLIERDTRLQSKPEPQSTESWVSSVSSFDWRPRRLRGG